MSSLDIFLQAQERVASFRDFLTLPPAPVLEQLPIDNDCFVTSARAGLPQGIFSECFDSDYGIRANGMEEASKITAAAFRHMEAHEIDTERYTYFLYLSKDTIVGEGGPHRWHIDGGKADVVQQSKFNRILLSNMATTAVGHLGGVYAMRPEALSDKEYWLALHMTLKSTAHAYLRPVLEGRGMDKKAMEPIFEQIHKASALMKSQAHQAKPFQMLWMSHVTPHAFTFFRERPWETTTPFRAYDTPQTRAILMLDVVPLE